MTYITMNGVNIRALSELFKDPNAADSDSEDEKPKSAAAAMGPAHVGPPKKVASAGNAEKKTANTNTKDIWAEDEVNDGQEFEDVFDPRPQPEYDVVYKQAVHTEDMFLGTGNKTPSTASCEQMVVKIKLPSTKISDVDLDVQDKFLNCRTPKFKLGLHLPHPVDSKNGRAQWNGDISELSVTLTMKREYDFMNF